MTQRHGGVLVVYPNTGAGNGPGILVYRLICIGQHVEILRQRFGASFWA